jgi:hypothetical protein
LSTNYGLPVLHIKGLIEEIKNEESAFANEIKGILEELRVIKID